MLSAAAADTATRTSASRCPWRAMLGREEPAVVSAGETAARQTASAIHGAAAPAAASSCSLPFASASDATSPAASATQAPRLKVK